MANRGTRLYVSDQEIVASQRTAGASQTQHNIHKPKPLVKLRKGEPAAKQAVDNTGDIRPDGADAALPLQDGSPWKRYREVLSLLDLGDKVVVACERSDPRKRVNIRKFPRDETEAEILSWFRSVRHANIVNVLQLFAGQKIVYVVLEEMHIPLDFLVRCPRQRSADEVGTIMGQILDGLTYLESRGFCHGALSCNSVLVNALGDVKIANQERCVRSSREAREFHIRQLGIIVMNLMQGYALESGKVGVEDVGSWRDSDILDFVSAVTSAEGASQLREHKFITEIWGRESRWPKEMLCDLVLTAQITVHRSYHYKPK